MDLMKRWTHSIVIVCTFAAACLCASPVHAQSASARVLEVYAEVAPGVMTQRALLPVQIHKPLFADVRLISKTGLVARTLLVALGDVRTAPGDVVEVAMGEHGRMVAGPFRAPTRVVRVESEQDVRLALRMDIPDFLRAGIDAR
jgi:hypothetical protein